MAPVHGTQMRAQSPSFCQSRARYCLRNPATYKRALHGARGSRGHRAATPRAQAAGGPPAALILPGFLSGAGQYEGLASILRNRGFTTEIVPLTFKDWLPVLSGGSFKFYVDQIDTALQRLHARHGPVALVGHSAGGWVARIVLGDEPYEGAVYSRRELVHTLVTLGTPHHSLEAYPFGRIEEQLSGPNLADVAPAVRGSSLKFANHFYPRGDSFAGVRMVCMVGNAIRGRTLWGEGSAGTDEGPQGEQPGWTWLPWSSSSSNSGSLWDSGEAGSSGSSSEAAGSPPAGSDNQWPPPGSPAPSRLDQYFAFESYKSGCGRGDVDGDGVTPIEIAHLPGAAANLTLPGVWHAPRRRPGQLWYGDEAVVAQWEQWLRLPNGGAAAGAGGSAAREQGTRLN